VCCLQEDCQVCLNTVDNVDQFLQDINQGKWDAVLPQITHLRLPTEKLYALYEQIVCEMIEMRETDTARAMLRTMKAFKRLQKDDAERFMRLDRMANPCVPLSHLSASLDA
jgi:WD40 repeat-containing protein SMU1